MREVVIVDSVRTGLAKSFRGKFNQTRPDDMAAHCVNALLERNDIDPASVEDCIVGAGSNEGAQGYNIGRNVAVLSRLGTGTAGMTLNRFCSSGLQAIAIAANQIASGCSDIIVAGGVESISLTMKSVNTDHLINPLLKQQTPGIYYTMGQTAEVVARRYGVSREAQDRYSLQSQIRTAQAQAAGLFNDEIVPMAVKYRVEDKNTGEVQILDGVVDRDDCNRRYHLRKPRWAETGVCRGRFGDGGQLVSTVRWCLNDPRDEPGKSPATGAQAESVFPWFHRRRLRTGRDGHRPGVLGAEAAQGQGFAGGGYRFVGAERSVCFAVPVQPGSTGDR